MGNWTSLVAAVVAVVCAPAVPARADTVTVRVATFNIENFNADSPQFEAARDVILRVGPDVICVEEMLQVAAFQALASATGYAHTVIASTGGAIDFSLRSGVMSKYPFVDTETATSVSLSGDPNAHDLSRNFIVVVVDLPGTSKDLTLAGNHWKSGFDDSDEFRRSVESIRAVQTMNGLNTVNDLFFVVGDMNDDINDADDTPANFFSLPGGLPGSFELGDDIVFPVENDVFNPLLAAGPSHMQPISAFQLDGSDGTRISGRRLDYLFRSDAVEVLGAEVYDSADEGIGGGLPKFGDPLPAGTSATASDHLLVFADITIVTDIGACCLPNGTCIDTVDEDECTGLQGFFYGIDTTCDDPLDPPCEPPPTGACCLPGGICTESLNESECVDEQGLYYGDDTMCDDPLDPPCEPPPTGACCLAGGICDDTMGQGDCKGQQGLYYGDDTTCQDPLDPPCVPPVASVVINEVLADQDGADFSEFIELFGSPGEDLTGLTVLLIEGETASKGIVDRAVSLDGFVLDGNGYLLIGTTGMAPDIDLGLGDTIENGTQTVLLVRNATVNQGDDIDVDNDGIADTSIGQVDDSVGLADSGLGGPDALYFNAPAVGPRDGAFPAGGARLPNGVDTNTPDDWAYLSAALDGSDGDVPITPRAENLPAGGGDGDFDDDGDRDLFDFGRLCVCFTGTDNGPVSPGCEPGDFDGDQDIDLADHDPFVDNLNGP